MRAILFDYGGTLDYPRHWLDRFLAHYQAAGLGLSRAQLDHGFTHATRMAYRATADLRQFGLEEIVNYLVRAQVAFLADDGDSVTRGIIADARREGRLAEAMARIVAGFVAESRAGMDASRAVLSVLTPRYAMGVVSNFYGNLERVLDEAGLGGFFAVVADSSRVGSFKPDPGIFAYALEKIGAPAHAAAMVGDSIDKDCAPARRLGMTAIWLPGIDHPDHDGGANQANEVDFTIRELAELKSLQWRCESAER
jgi:FMN phosphatase YigB (HAD superfamily)